MAKSKRSTGLADKVRQKKKGDINKRKVLNPFEVHINKEKFRVLGKKSKSDRGLPGVSRAKAIKKRQETLGTEYKLQNKTNTFLDRRIGEKGDSLNGEDKIIARFAAERIKQHKINTGKKSIFNLADDEVLTHRGQTLEEIEKFDDPRSSDDEDDDGRKFGGLEDEFVSEGHFGGGVLSRTESKDGAKSHKDLIELLITESKKRKAEKQKLREQTLDLTEKLDTDWKDLQPLVSKKAKTDDGESAIDKLLRDNERRNEDYDKVMRELRFESRGTPSDGLKTEEEIAKKQKEKLDKLEKERLDRMHGTFASTTNTKHRSADDLDDNFEVDNEPNYMISYDADGNPLVPEHILRENTFSDKRKTRILEDDEEEESSEDENSDSQDESENLQNSDDKNPQSRKENKQKAGQQEEIERDSEESDNESDNDSTDSLKDLKESEDTDSEEDITEIIVEQSQENIKDTKVAEIKNVTKEIKEHTEITKPTAEIKKQAGKKIKQGSEKTHKLKQSMENTKESEDDSDDESLGSLKALKESTESESDETENVAEKVTEMRVNFGMRPTEELLHPSRRVNADLEAKDVKLEIDEGVKKKIKEDLLARKEIMEKAAKELPYTYEMPDSYEDLQELLSGKLPEYQGIILERLIKCYHPSLSAVNKDKLAVLFTYLLQYVNDLFFEITTPEKLIDSFRAFDKIAPFLYDLSRMNIMHTKRSLSEVLQEKREDFNKNTKVLPGLDTLIFLKLVSLIFPTSDFRHPVVTPCLVFMSEILTYGKYKNRTDIARGFFVMALILEYTVLSKRFVPSAINFIRGILYMCANTTILNPIKVVPPFRNHAAHSKMLLLQSDCNESVITTSQMTAKDMITEDIDNDFRIRSFITCIRMFKELFENCNEVQSQGVLFQSHIELLGRIDLEIYPSSVREEVVKTRDSIKATLETKTYTLLAPDKKKPKALKLYEPDVQDVFTGRVSKKVSREKAEHDKLVHKYKRETKGALREIRRDRAYLGAVQIKKKIESDNIRKAKVKEIFKDASIQQGELNQLKRKK